MTPVRPRTFKPGLQWFLLLVPVAFLLRYIENWRNDLLLFAVSSFGIVPLAGLMGRSTEHLARRVGPGLGGLLNATFGNAAELIICLLALSRGLTAIVKASITGSIIGNILLVLGASIVAGGFKFQRQTFNRVAVQASSTSLLLAAIALFTPTIFHATASTHPHAWAANQEQHLSLAIAIILFICYGCVLLFSLKTHRDLFSGTAPDNDEEAWSLGKSIGVLLLATIVTAFLAEFLVGTVESARRSLGLTDAFVGVIVVAVVGNAAEHATAIMVARKNQMDLSISVALGSSLQVALFVAPVLVFASYIFGQPMNLEFTLPELFAVIASVYIVARICADGETNWLEGVQLLAVYAILALLFYFLPPK